MVSRYRYGRRSTVTHSRPGRSRSKRARLPAGMDENSKVLTTESGRGRDLLVLVNDAGDEQPGLVTLLDARGRTKLRLPFDTEQVPVLGPSVNKGT